MSLRFRIRRSELALLHDILISGAAFLSALWTAGVGWRDLSSPYLWAGLPLFVFGCAISFRAFGLYRGVWRYASMLDLLAVGMAATVAVAIFVPIMLLIGPLQGLPVAFLVNAWFTLIVFLGAPRFIYRYFKDRRALGQKGIDAPEPEPVLLIGAGDAAEQFIRAVTGSPDPHYQILGLLDEKGRRVGRVIHGIPILGSINDLRSVVARISERGPQPKQLILTKGRDKIDAVVVRRLLDDAEALHLALSRLPAEDSGGARTGSPMQLRPIEIEDLLGRPQAALDRSALGQWLQGRRILVTGAGGTIGSELSLQIAEYRPEQLILVENSEFNLYSIELAIRERAPDVTVRAIIRDVRDRDGLFRTFEETQPELVYHAAALKHVPIVELNPCEGALTNVSGSRNVADACRDHGVQAMVLISTDKAVNPGSVMGATKRIAESYCQALDVIAPAGDADEVTRRTRYMTVRFGNVLGSTGSVVPLFQRQIARGGPIHDHAPRCRAVLHDGARSGGAGLAGFGLRRTPPMHSVARSWCSTWGGRCGSTIWPSR